MSSAARTVSDVLRTVPAGVGAELPAPFYKDWGDNGPRLGLAVESMKRHTTDEGWQLFAGLGAAGYELCGHNLTFSQTDVEKLVRGLMPSTVVLQDKREWEGRTAGGSRGNGFDRRETFTNVGYLKQRPDVFKLTVLKDAHRDNEYHRESAEEIGAHGWVTYYHPRIVKHLSPYVRTEHLLRTYHSVDADTVPAYSDRRRDMAALSGAVSGMYPLRSRLLREVKDGRGGWMHYRPHPGYGRSGCDTPSYMAWLSQYRVAICTSSVLGFAVRKIVEATACGCRVITDLPVDDVLPWIDKNLVRVHPETLGDMANLVSQLCDDYDPGSQYGYSQAAKGYYDYRTQGRKLAADIERLRTTYNGDAV